MAQTSEMRDRRDRLFPDPLPSLCAAPMARTVVQRAEELLARYLSSWSSQRSYMIDTEILAELAGCIVERSSLPRGTDGLLIPGPQHFTIRIDSDHSSKARARFTIAHEIAHTFFFARDVSNRPRKLLMLSHAQEEEDLCNVIASFMLVPSSLLCKILRPVLQPGPGMIFAIARRFGVSTEVAARRLKLEVPEFRHLGFCEWIAEETYLAYRRLRFSSNPAYEPFVLNWLISVDSVGNTNLPRGSRLRAGTAISDLLLGSRRSIAGSDVRVGQRLSVHLDKVGLHRVNGGIDRVLASFTRMASR